MQQTQAENLRRARVAADLSQEELADAAGIDRTYVSALERCRYSVSIDVLERLATALSVTQASLLADVEDVSANVADT